MKPTKFLPIVMIAAAGLVASCSTSKLATTSQADDVYNTVAKAREVEIVPQQQYAQNQNNDQNQEGYDEYYGTSNPYYDMDYSSRINRFSNGTSWRGYYDPYYDNFSYGNSYGATNYLGYGGLGWSSGYGLGGWGGGFGLGFGYGSIWNNPFYYGNMGFGWNNWGPYSYYDRFGWGYGGGYYGGGVYTGNSNTIRRAGPGAVDNRMRRSGTGISYPNYGRPARNGYVDQNGNRMTPNNIGSRPTRNSGYAPQQQNNRPPRNENYTPPTRSESRPTYSPPPSNNGGGSRSSGGGSYGGGSRGSRGGRG